MDRRYWTTLELEHMLTIQQYGGSSIKCGEEEYSIFRDYE